MSSISPADNQQQVETQWQSRLPIILLLAGALLLLGWAGLKAWRLAQIARSFQQYQVQAEELTENGLLNVDPDRAARLVLNMRRDVRVLVRETRPFVPVAQRLGWIPRIGPLLENSEAFLEMADAGSEAAAYAMRGLKPALVQLHADGAGGPDLMSQILPVIDAAQADLYAASESLDRFKEARADIDDLDAFPWRIRTLMEQIDGKLYLADEMKLLAVFPAIMGADGPRTYLIMAQNEDEIRATGGFLTGAGRLTVDDGQIVELSFQDANTIDNWREKPYDLPPKPLYELMALELFLFRDANYWPDFPTSAEKAMELFRYGQNQAAQFDGVIAIDQQFVALLLAVTGPLRVRDLQTTVSSSNLIANLREAWGAGDDETHANWLRERKDFLGPLAQAIQAQLLDNFEALDPLYLAETIHRAAREKHLQIYVRDPRTAAILNEIDWDGRMEWRNDADRLMIVETNVGYNKVNPLVNRAVQYDVDLADDGTATANLAITYQHTGQNNVAPCEQIIPYAQGITYETLIDQCYWNFVRIYVPEDVDPLELAQHSLPLDTMPVGSGWRNRGPTIAGEGNGSSVITSQFVLPRGQTLTSSYVYRLPHIVVGGDADRRYRLDLRKPPGLDPYPFSIRVTLPGGTSVRQTSPAAVINGQQVTFELELRSDLDIEIVYGRGPS